MSDWIAIILGGVVTYLTRASFIAFTGDRQLPTIAARALRYVGPAAFAAIVLPRVLGDRGLSGLSSPDAALLAVIGSGVLVWTTRNIPLGLIGGMVALWLLQWAGL